MPITLAHPTGDETVPHTESQALRGLASYYSFGMLFLEAYAEVPPEAPIIWLFLNYS